MSNHETRYDTIIIGAGPAGLFTGSLLRNGRTLILEKNRQTGQKLLISGTGQCNFTHAGPMSDFYKHYGDNHRFLRPAFSAFTNLDLVNFFGGRGLKTVEDKNGKLFPATQRAMDVLNVLLNACKDNKIQLRTGLPVSSISVDQGAFFVTTQEETFICNNLVIATGGESYPTTGSSGDGYRFAALLGHTLVPTRPALSPVFIKDYSFASLSGVSLDDAAIQLHRNQQKIRSHTGDIGFTHKGLTGPGILDFSRYMLPGDTLKVNFCGLTCLEFEKQFIETANLAGKTSLQGFLRKTNMPKSLMLAITEMAGLQTEKPLAEISRDSRNKLVKLCCEFPFIIEKTAGFKAAMVTAGGVSLQEVNPKTMESKLVKNLYFAGEVLDIDGDTGGYNIQAAFSTAFLAAESINTNS